MRGFNQHGHIGGPGVEVPSTDMRYRDDENEGDEEKEVVVVAANIQIDCQGGGEREVLTSTRQCLGGMRADGPSMSLRFSEFCLYHILELYCRR